MESKAKMSLMECALGDDWAALPEALRAHYQRDRNEDIGRLDIEYPILMQPYLHVLRLFGALVNRRGQAVPTTVEKGMEGEVQFWRRSIRFPDGRVVFFKSYWVYAGGNELIEFVNPFLGLRMAVCVKDGQLHYSGQHLVLQMGRVRLPIFEWLLLGHTTIVEEALDDRSFSMDFRLIHPWFGQIFRYAGVFGTHKTVDLQ